MGNTIECNLNDEELKRYRKPGIYDSDLRNMKKAFILLDKNKDGTISYDIKKLDEDDTLIDLPHDPSNENHVLLTFDQFMNIMTTNILKNREKFGKENIVFESETSNVVCLICPYPNRKKD